MAHTAAQSPSADALVAVTDVQEEAADAGQLSLGWQQLHAGQDYVAVVARGQPGHILWPPPPDGATQHGRAQLL